jgi:hypothetical protein
MQCKIRQSFTNNYYTWIEITNFAAIPAGGLMRVIIGKVSNPNIKQIDIDFKLRVATIDLTTNI